MTMELLIDPRVKISTARDAERLDLARLRKFADPWRPRRECVPWMSVEEARRQLREHEGPSFNRGIFGDPARPGEPLPGVPGLRSIGSFWPGGAP